MAIYYYYCYFYDCAIVYIYIYIYLIGLFHPSLLINSTNTNINCGKYWLFYFVSSAVEKTELFSTKEKKNTKNSRCGVWVYAHSLQEQQQRKRKEKKNPRNFGLGFIFFFHRELLLFVC